MTAMIAGNPFSMISRTTNNETTHGSIYVIILNWNQWGLTVECVKSILQLAYPNMHLVVVDNGSTDDSTNQFKKELGETVTLLCNPVNSGYAAGNNVGIQHAMAQNATHIMVLNNDTIVGQNFFAPLLQRLMRDPQIGVVTPKIYFMQPENQIWAAGGRINWWLGKAASFGRGQVDRGQFDESCQIDYATGCCFIARRELFEIVGLLDENFFAYFEDTDWCMRVRKSGWQIWYEPESTLRHWAGASSKNENKSRKGGVTSPFIYYLGIRNNLWFLRRHATGVRLPIGIGMLMIWHVLYYTAGLLILRRWSKLHKLWHGVIDGFRRMDSEEITSRDHAIL